ncbi:helix-turn-helix domain-containing protein [Bacillus sp. 03113]|uniref:ArsR/SmtB family transcription factor n=1 Tax=Bacillus sp. 03113 TaxID=2578211 RepID=UPI0011434BF2|nr:helix-turn-helix domain-containing protein [Bacillus sp. 03113]
MKQKSCMILKNYEQLKTISDPFRTKILMLLVEQPYTGQQLAHLLEVPRSKIHYALTELEKNGFIQVVKKEEKGGIIQKFYQSTARSYYPSDQLLPFSEDLGNYVRDLALNVLERAKIRALSAPEEAFQFNTADKEKWPMISMQLEAKVNEEEFIKWLAKYRKLLEEFNNMKDDKGKFFYMTTVGFQIDEPFFEDNKNL